MLSTSDSSLRSTKSKFIEVGFVVSSKLNETLEGSGYGATLSNAIV